MAAGVTKGDRARLRFPRAMVENAISLAAKSVVLHALGRCLFDDRCKGD